MGKAPNWDVWENVPVVMIWEAVALSIGINLNFLRKDIQSESWLEEFKKKFPIFADRLLVAMRNATSLSVKSKVGEDLEWFVPLNQFAALACVFGWQIPPHMMELADAYMARYETDAKPDKQQVEITSLKQQVEELILGACRT